MRDLRSRSERSLALLERFQALGISNMAWKRQTILADPVGKGVSYQTIRRLMEGKILTHSVMDKLEAGLDREEQSRVRTAA